MPKPLKLSSFNPDYFDILTTTSQGQVITVELPRGKATYLRHDFYRFRQALDAESEDSEFVRQAYAVRVKLTLLENDRARLTFIRSDDDPEGQPLRQAIASASQQYSPSEPPAGSVPELEPDHDQVLGELGFNRSPLRKEND